MKNWMKNIDLDQMKDQISDLKDQVQDIRFRKPWTKGDEPSPFLFMALGAALAWAGMAIYRNREEVAHFCSNCGARIKEGWDQSGIRQKAERAMGKAKEGAREAMSSSGNGQEPRY
jgi:hypothetical protein